MIESLILHIQEIKQEYNCLHIRDVHDEYFEMANRS